MRPLACQLVEEADLSHYQAQYDNQNKRIAAPIHEAENLIPPIRKHTYAPDIDPSLLIHDEAVFQALMGIDWTTVDFQPLGRETEVEAAWDDVTKFEPEAGLNCFSFEKTMILFWAPCCLVIG